MTHIKPCVVSFIFSLTTLILSLDLFGVYRKIVKIKLNLGNFKQYIFKG